MDIHDIESRHRTRFLLSDTVPLSETAPHLNKEDDSSYNIPLVEYSTCIIFHGSSYYTLGTAVPLKEDSSSGSAVPGMGNGRRLMVLGMAVR